MRVILQILSWLYRGVMTVRNALFDLGVFPILRSKRRVVSIGNLTAGGNGKTVIALALAEAALARGVRPVILSRGDGGSARGPYEVLRTDPVRVVGDEPLMMRQLLPDSVAVVVARNRVEGVRLIDERNLGDIIILDDGLQHRWLHRDLNIVAVNITGDHAIEDFLAGKVLPAGMFREDRDAALRRTDIVLWVARAPQDAQKDIAAVQALIPTSCQQFQIAMEGKPLVCEESVRARVHGEGVTLVTGIANPEGVVGMMKALGFWVKEHKAFKDHHLFRASDFAAFSDRDLLVCTRKDYVRLPAGIRERFLVVDVTIGLPEEFLKQVFG